jgi:diguanylate cyclase (GGDEF)-like protein
MTISIPESPYATQLAQGFRGLRFARVLEREFELEFARQNLPRMQLGFAGAAGLYFLFTLLRLRVESGTAADYGLVLRMVAVGGMLLPLVGSLIRPLRPFVTSFVLLGYAALAMMLTGVEIVANRYGVERHYEGLILVSFHIYVFGGLLLRPALIAGAFVLLAYGIGGAFGGLAGREWGYQLLFIGLTHVIGGGALYFLERLERENFLRRKLFGVLATHDGLTGMLNRMAFFGQAERLLRQAARDKVAIGVVMIDIDHFKAYNDHYGHLEGDACLRAVANGVREEFKRPMDVFARYGGEEFIGLWYDIQPQALRSLGDQVRARVQALRIAHSEAPSGRVTVSVGAIACIPNEGEPLVALIKRADAVLYEAKERGRNRVVIEVLPSAAGGTATRSRRAPTVSDAG